MRALEGAEMGLEGCGGSRVELGVLKFSEGADRRTGGWRDG